MTEKRAELTFNHLENKRDSNDAGEEEGSASPAEESLPDRCGEIRTMPNESRKKKKVEGREARRKKILGPATRQKSHH